MSNKDLILTGLPGWLQPHKKDLGPPYTEYTIEKILLGVSSGSTLRQVCEEDPTLPDWKEFCRWVLKHPTLKEEYYEAQCIGAEMLAEETLNAAKGLSNTTTDGIPEDVQRSALVVKTMMWLIEKRNKRYGEKRQLDVMVYDIGDAMAKAQERIDRQREKVINE